MAARWQREVEPEAAVDRILDAAEKTFIEQGVSAAGMGAIAEAAGCSRGTLYRYFPDRHELHVAYVERETRRIVARVRVRVGSIGDPRERLVESLVAAVGEVRANPGTAAWFEPASSGVAARMGRASEVTETLATAFVARLAGEDERGPDARLRARWLVRVVISLLTLPGENEAEERALVERFVAPGIVPPA